VNDFWYSNQEIASFKRRDRHILRLMEDYDDNDNNNNTSCIARLIINQDDSIDGHCTRGLEGRTRQAQYRRRCTREAAQLSVFQEQAQKCSPLRSSSVSSSPEETQDAIAKRYIQWSEQSQRYAHDRALKDEQSVRELLAGASDASFGSMTPATMKTKQRSPPPRPQRRLAQGVSNSPTVPSPRQLSMLIVACLAA
jgi:hypothetical protein